MLLPYFENYYQVFEPFYHVGEKLYEIKILEETHKQEVSRLQKRLQWYAENQELLDKDAARLREANEEAEKLRLEVRLHMRQLLWCHSWSFLSWLPHCSLLVSCTGGEPRAPGPQGHALALPLHCILSSNPGF